MLHIARLGYAAFATHNVEAMWHYYTEVIGFSLVTLEDDGTAYLRNSADHHTIVFHPSTENRLLYLGLQLGGQQTLAEAADYLRAQGITVRIRAYTHPGIPELLEFKDPEGNSIQLYTTIEQTGRVLLERGIAPEKLGHVALRVLNMEKMVHFYQQRLNFRISDRVENSLVFLRCNPDHHTIHLVQSRTRKKANKLHHIGFQLHDWAHLQRACDHLAKKNIPITWGPGRHGPGHSLFTFHQDPDGNMVEFYTDLDLMLNEDLEYFEPRPWHSDHPQRPKVWPHKRQTANLWGVEPPRKLMS